MTPAIRRRALKLTLRILGILLMQGWIMIALILSDSALVAPGTILAGIFRWHPYNPAYESMILGMYIVLGGLLWRAAVNPEAHRSLIAFAIWGNLIHAGIMVLFALRDRHELTHMWGDILILLVVAGLLWWFQPRSAFPPQQP